MPATTSSQKPEPARHSDFTLAYSASADVYVCECVYVFVFGWPHSHAWRNDAPVEHASPLSDVGYDVLSTPCDERN